MGVSLASASVVVAKKFSFRNSLDGRNVEDKLDKSYASALTDGTGANQGQIAYYDERSLPTTNSEELDLTALESAFGVASFTKVKHIIIEVTTLTAGYRLLIGGAASDAWETALGGAGDIDRVDAGGILVKTSPVDGFAVNSTNKILKIANPSGGGINYSIEIVGTGSVA